MSRNPRACARALVATLMLSLLPSNRWQQRRLVRHVRYGRASPWLIGDTIALPALRNQIACLGYTAGFVRMFYNDAIPESFDAASDGPLLSARKAPPRNSEWRRQARVDDPRILGPFLFLETSRARVESPYCRWASPLHLSLNRFTSCVSLLIRGRLTSRKF